MADRPRRFDNSSADKLKPNDPRAPKRSTVVDGRRWHYLDAQPEGPAKGTVLLIHGFPDLSLGWRYQIPLLTSLGFRCIALDCMGYGDTGTSDNLKDFSFKTHADAIAAIAKAIGAHHIIIGGHDWGGFAVWRIAQFYPDLVSHVFSVCTAYAPTMEKFVSTEEMARGPLPQFGYQLQFGSEDGIVEKAANDEVTISRFLNGMYGGRTASGKPFMTPEKGVGLELLKDEISMTPLVDEEEFAFYLYEFTRNGMRGPCNWYRTRNINWSDEQSLPVEAKKGIKQPALFIQALNDAILKPEMARGMDRHIPHLTRADVPAGHWALWQTPVETNAIIREWFLGVVLGGKSKL